MKQKPIRRCGLRPSIRDIAAFAIGGRIKRDVSLFRGKGVLSASMLVVCTVVLASCATTTPKTGKWEIERVHNPPKPVFSNSLAIDGHGNPMLAYKCSVSWGTYGIEFTERRNGAWRTELVDEEDARETFGGAVLAVDSHDDPHILYFKGHQILYAIRQGGAWKKEVVSSSHRAFGGLNMVLDAHDQPWIFYVGHDTDANLYLSTRKNGVWSREVVANGERASNSTSLCFNSQGKIGIAYFSERDGMVRIARRENGGWKTERVVTAKPRQYFLPQIAVDKNDHFVVAYVSYSSGQQDLYGLYFARENGNGTWSISQLSDKPTASLSLQRDEKTKNLVMLRDGPKGIELSTNAGNGWKNEVVMDGSGLGKCELAISKGGKVGVSVLVREGSDHLMFASRK